MLVDLVKINANSTGTGAITLGSAVPGYRGRETLTNGETYSYSIQQEAQWEVGRGTLLDGQLIRSPFYTSSGNTPIDLQPNAAVAFVALTADLIALAGGDVTDPTALAAEIARATSVETFLNNRIALVAAGLLSYRTRALLFADDTRADGTLAYVYGDSTPAYNTVYHADSGVEDNWVVDTQFYQGLASLVQPLVQQAQDAATTAVNAANTATAAGVTYLTATGTGNAVTVNTPPEGFREGRLYRFIAPATTTGAITINDRALLDVTGFQAQRPGWFVAGGDVIVRFREVGVVFVTVLAVTRRLETVEDLLAALQPEVERNSADSVLTRDAWSPLLDRQGTNLFGSTTYSAGVMTNVRQTIPIVTLGNSHGGGQGTTADNKPGEQLRRVYAAFVPEADVTHTDFSVPGSWQSQIGAQLDAVEAAGIVPAVWLTLDPTNDTISGVYHSLQSPPGYRSAFQSNVARMRRIAPNSVILSVTAPFPHPTRSLASGRFDFPDAFFCSWPKTCFVSFDGFQTYTYNAANQTISTNVPGQFFASNGMLAAGSYLYRQSTNTFYGPLVSVAADGSSVTLPAGSITANETATDSLRQAKINSETQLTPRRSQSIAPRRINGLNKPAITVSVRVLQMNRVCREETALAGAVLIDWATAQAALLTSDSVYDTLYPNNDDFHMGDVGYQLLAPLFADAVSRIINGA